MFTPGAKVELLQRPTECPDDQLPFARAFIAVCRFTVAKTVPLYPHQYCLREWVPDARQDDYARFIELITYYGYNGRFLRTTYRYLNIDGWRYWESPTIDRSGMIVNRAQNSDLRQEGEC